MKARVSSIATLSLMAVAVSLTGGSQVAEAESPNSFERVSISPLVVVSGDENGPDPDDPIVKALRSGDLVLPSEELKLPWGTSLQSHREVEVGPLAKHQINEAQQRLEAETQHLLERRGLIPQELSGGDIAPAAVDTKVGPCGSATISFGDASAFSDRTAYVSGNIESKYYFWAYRMNFHIWNTAAFDFWEKNIPYTGNNGGNLYWAEYDEFLVNDSGDTYGAKYNRADLYIGGDRWCYMGGPPTVDNVRVR